MKENINTFRTTARTIGIIYVLGFVVGIGGEMLVKSVLDVPDHLSIIPAQSMAVVVGALLWMVAVFWDVLHGVLLFPILKQFNERIAVGYLSFRIMDATFIALMVLFILLQMPLADEYLKAVSSDRTLLSAISSVFSQGQLFAYTIGMMMLGIAGLMLCHTLYKARLIPRVLAIWGFIGYAIIFLGMASEIAGSGLGLISSLPGGLWELFIGVLLIVKGFSPAAFSSRSSKTLDMS